MLRSIKRSLSNNNLSPPRVRFAPESKIGRSTSPVSMEEGDTNEASTMEGDTISSASTVDSMSTPLDDAPGCTKGDSVDFVGVASESYRAIALSAWLVSETMYTIGAEIIRIPHHCGFDSSLDDDDTDDDDSRQFDEVEGKRNRSFKKTRSGTKDDSSLVSYPPSSRQRRRKRPFGFFGLVNRAKKNHENGLPTTVTTAASKPNPSSPASSKPSSSSPQCTPFKKAPVKKPPTTPRDDTFHKEPSPIRAKKLLTACFVKKPYHTMIDDEDDHTLTTLQSRYRHDHEDLEVQGTSSVYTIRMSRVPTAEYQSL